MTKFILLTPFKYGEEKKQIIMNIDCIKCVTKEVDYFSKVFISDELKPYLKEEQLTAYEQRLNDKQRLRFAFMLKQKRKDNKLSQAKLSDILGYAQSDIYKWETCKARPNLYQVEDVATYFNLPLNVLIGE